MAAPRAGVAAARWFPFELYRQSHSQHHRNSYLTYPNEDTESYYHDEEDWEDYGDPWRWLLVVNQTFLGRLLIGPVLRTPRLFFKEAGKMIAGDECVALDQIEAAIPIEQRDVGVRRCQVVGHRPNERDARYQT